MILLPYVDLHPATAAWLAAHRRVEQVYVGGRDEAYWEALSIAWHIDTDLVVVEHDMVPATGVIESMLHCRTPWCVSPYRIGNNVLLTEGLGCTRFSLALRERVPNALHEVGVIADHVPAKSWRRLDVRLASVLRSYSYEPHCHAESRHMHDYQGE